MIDILKYKTLLAQTSSPLSSIPSFLPIIFIFLIFYFLLIRPQSKKQKVIETKRKLLSKGDRIITQGGIYGKVEGVNIEKGIVNLLIDKEVKIELSLHAVTEVILSDEELKKRQEKLKESSKK